MDHQVAPELVRRSLLTIEVSNPAGVVIVEGVREPFAADGLTNKLRQINSRFDPRRFMRAAYNRRQRTLYARRLPQRAGWPSESGKRTAPPKFFGTRLRGQR